ncbi:hypothetical protein [Cellulomonas pakistanensis]|uniref:Uncharacterized protein n=1 Tax=Cellulomonas pakistanensis TaxID=992287 RepID=A0A919U573_9CELL|nr:hypothetical protein [Cellulomonas pakistanensis]GIG35005.1 hypothetical protein Cpa01nite_03860 [Cellulomonas pakistanensis]
MPTQPRPDAVPGVATDPLREADPLPRARLLAAMLGRPLTGAELERRGAEDGVPEAVEALVLSGAARRTPDGGLALDRRRRSDALDALARDLRVGAHDARTSTGRAAGVSAGADPAETRLGPHPRPGAEP